MTGRAARSEGHGRFNVDQKKAALCECLGASSPSGSNTALITREQNLTEALDLNLGTEGETDIFRPGDEYCRRNGQS